MKPLLSAGGGARRRRTRRHLFRTLLPPLLDRRLHRRLAPHLFLRRAMADDAWLGGAREAERSLGQALLTG